MYFRSTKYYLNYLPYSIPNTIYNNKPTNSKSRTPLGNISVISPYIVL